MTCLWALETDTSLCICCTYNLIFFVLAKVQYTHLLGVDHFPIEEIDLVFGLFSLGTVKLEISKLGFTKMGFSTVLTSLRAFESLSFVITLSCLAVDLGVFSTKKGSHLTLRIQF